MARSFTEYQDLQDFHARFGCHYNRQPGFLPNDYMQFRLDFLKEELTETLDAYTERDLAKFADGLVDLVYVAIGTAELMGLPWPDLWAAVQAANMRKERAQPEGDDRSHRNSEFDVVKPKGWTPPPILEILKGVSHYDREASIVGRSDQDHR